MKKTIVLIMLIFLAGCSTNKLTCTGQESSTGYLLEEKYVYTFKNDEVSKASMTATRTLLGANKTAEALADHKTVADAAAKYYNGQEGVSASVTAKNDQITLSVTMKPSKMENLWKEQYELNMSLKETKKAFEEKGYTCE